MSPGDRFASDTIVPLIGAYRFVLLSAVCALSTPAWALSSAACAEAMLAAEDVVLVEDGPGASPDLSITGALPDLVALLVTPLWGGVPSPMNPRGRAAMRMFASRRVRIQGRVGVLRSFLGVIRL